MRIKVMDSIIIILLMTLGFALHDTDSAVGSKSSKDLSSERTTWMTYLGCFGGNLNNNVNVKILTLENNQPKTCSRRCRNFPFFALKNKTCYCFGDDSIKILRENWINNCHMKCEGSSSILYCGSNTFYSVYKRITDFNVSGNGDCISVKNGVSNLFRQPCELNLPYICKKQGDLKIIEDPLNFFNAKLFCENIQGRLFFPDDSMDIILKDGRTYWIGTFRQIVDVHPEQGAVNESIPEAVRSATHPTTRHYEETIASEKDTTNRLYTRSSVDSSYITDNTVYTSPFVDNSYRTTNPVHISPSIDSSNKTTQQVYSKPSIDNLYKSQSSEAVSDFMKTGGKQGNDVFQCGSLCFVLGFSLCLVVALAMMVCLFKIRQQWNVFLQRNIEIAPHKYETGENQTDGNENTPVYLDPANQKAVFLKRNLSKVNQHIYDEVEVYSKANQPVRRQACLSGYQDLNFTKLNNQIDVLPIEDKIESAKYEEPWGDKNNEKRIKSCITFQTKKTFPFTLHSKTVHKTTAMGQPYQETMIDVRKYLYDRPQTNIEGNTESECNRYKFQENRDQLKGGLVMTKGRELSKAGKNEKDLKRKEEFTDNSVTVDSPIYATPQQQATGGAVDIKHESLFKSKRKMIKSKFLSLPKSIKKFHSKTVNDNKDGYDVPNPVKQSQMQSKAIPLNPLNKVKFHGLVNINGREVAQKPTDDVAIPSGRQKKSNVSGNYELAKPLNDVGPESRNRNDDNIPIYFEPVR